MSQKDKNKFADLKIPENQNRINKWEEIGADAIRADLEHNSGVQFVGGTQKTRKLAREWLDYKKEEIKNSDTVSIKKKKKRPTWLTITALASVMTIIVGIIVIIDFAESEPRKELNDMGIAWNIENFNQSLFNNDSIAVKLFLKGGMKVSPKLFSQLGDADHEILAILIKTGAVTSKKHCGINKPFYKSVMASPNRFKIIKQLCGTQEFTAKINEYRNNLRGKLPRINDPTEDVQHCVNTLNNKYGSLDKLLDEYRLKNRDIFEKDLLVSSEDLIFSKLYTYMITGDTDNLDYNKLINLGCEESNAIIVQSNKSQIKQYEFWNTVYQKLTE